jgi:hypothetical protein
VGVATAVTYVPWVVAAEGYLWWDGFAALTWGGLPYTTERFLTTGFGYSATYVNVPGPDDTYRVQFSRPPVNPPTLQFRFRDNGGTLTYDPVLHNIDATLTSQGALYLIRPKQALRHVRTYTVEYSVDGSTWANATVVFGDALGNSLTQYGYLGAFSTPDTLRAVITASGGVLSSAGASLLLSAAPAAGNSHLIASSAWRQINGTPLLLSTPQAATTQVRWSATPPVDLENIVIELTITDTAGDVETAQVTVSALNPSTTGPLLYFRGAPGDYIGGGQTVLASSTTGSFSASPFNSGYVSYSYIATGYTSWWTLNLASADGSPLRVGAYENAIRAPFHDQQNGIELFGSGRGCNQILGRFDVLELQTDVSGTITAPAVDFEQHCESASAPPLFGSLRINSTLPLRP